MRISLFLAASLLVGGCGRWPGPHESEVGKLTWWILVGGGPDTVTSTCASATYVAEFALQDELPYHSGWRWYVNYEVEAGLTSAVGWNCRSDDWRDCVKSPTERWTIAEHDVSLPTWRTDTTLGNDACTVKTVDDARFEDGGKAGTFVRTRTYELTGDAAACDAVDADARARSDNGHGLRGCTYSREYPFRFSHAAKL